MNKSTLKRKPTLVPSACNKKQRGATLIEAMVSLFVFAVGALGIAAMQTSSLVRVDDTKQRSIAIWKAQELVDRMRNSKTVADPDGLLPEYLAEIDNDNSDNGIGVLDGDDDFPCPAAAAAPQRCDDVNGTNVAACSTAQLVAFDVWSVMCDPNSGIALTGAGNDGSVGLRNVEVAMERTGTEFRLYIEWLNRSATSNVELGVDAEDVVRTVTTNLCGDDKQIDARLDAYCLRFE